MTWWMWLSLGILAGMLALYVFRAVYWWRVWHM